MIFGNIKDYESGFAWLPQPLKTVIEHLKQTDFQTLPVGNCATSDTRGMVVP